MLDSCSNTSIYVLRDDVSVEQQGANTFTRDYEYVQPYRPGMGARSLFYSLRYFEVLFTTWYFEVNTTWGSIKWYTYRYSQVYITVAHEKNMIMKS